MFEPELGKRGIDRELKKLRDHIAAHPALVFDARVSQTTGGNGLSVGNEFTSLRLDSNNCSHSPSDLLDLVY